MIRLLVFYFITTISFAQVNPEALNNLGKAIEKEALARGMDDQALAAVKMKTLPQIQRYMNYADK